MSAVLESPVQERTVLLDYTQKYQERVLMLAREMHAESVTHRNMPLDEPGLAAQLLAAAKAPDSYCRIAVRGEDVLGGFLGQIGPGFFTTERGAKELVWFVKPSARGSRAAIMLLADFEIWGRFKGARKCFLSQSTGVAVDETARLFVRLGYRVVGVNAMKEI